MDKKDLSGSIIGSLKVIRKLNKYDFDYDRNHGKYMCICLACGKEDLIIRADHLKESKKRSHKGCHLRKDYFKAIEEGYYNDL